MIRTIGIRGAVLLHDDGRMFCLHLQASPSQSSMVLLGPACQRFPGLCALFPCRPCGGAAGPVLNPPPPTV